MEEEMSEWKAVKARFAGPDGDPVDTGQWVLAREHDDGTHELYQGDWFVRMYESKEQARTVADRLNSPSKQGLREGGESL